MTVLEGTGSARGIGRVLISACALVLAAGCAPPAAPGPSLGIGDAVMAGRLEGRLDALQRIANESGGTRAAGTPGFDRSADWVAAELGRLGYEVRFQRFQFWSFDEPAAASLQIVESAMHFAEPADLRTMIYSASGSVTAPVVSVGFDPAATTMDAPGCRAADWTAFPAGAIALLGPGDCWRREQVLRAEDAGAAAVIVAYPWLPAGGLRQPTLVSPDGIRIPALVASGSAGRQLLAAAATAASVSLSVSTVVRVGETRNVLATPRSGLDGPFVLVGAHLDSVRDGPGIDDNGSGVAALLALAEAAAGRPEAARLAYAFWGAEELGDVGSDHYVRTLDSDPRPFAYLNADMLGSPNGVAFVYDATTAPPGSAVIQRLLERELDALGVVAEPIDLTSGSDGAPFAAAGIPMGGVFSGAGDPKTADEVRTAGGTAGIPYDPCYHLACDDRANVDSGRLLALAGAVAGVALTLARSGSVTS